MNGMEMMLKSMGIDVEAIKDVANPQTVKRVIDTLLSISDALESIDKKLTRIEVRLETMPTSEAMKLLSDGKELAEKEAMDYVRANTDGNSYN